MMITSPENITYNEPKLKKLAWVLEASQGKFKLFIVRCNYQLLRLQLIGYLQQISTQNILIIELPEDEQDIYSKIKIELEEKTPDVLMITGWELVQNVDSLLTSANQLRDAFAKEFNFPLILWLNDDIYQKMVRLAPDLESWGTTRDFSLPTEALINSVKEGIEILFNAAFSGEASGFFTTLAMIQDLGNLQRSELVAAWRELRNREQELEPYIQASLEFAQGLNAPYSPAALEYFQNSLNFWQSQLEGQNTEQTSSLREYREQELSPYVQASLEFVQGLNASNSPGTLENFQNSLNFWPSQLEEENTEQNSDYKLKEALLQYYIGCYYYFHENWEQARNYTQKCCDIFKQNNRGDLLAKSVTQLERILQRLNLWDELDTLGHQAVEIHKEHDIFDHKLAQDYGFLAEVYLQKEKWQKVQKYAQKGLAILANLPENERGEEGLYLLFLAKAEKQLGNELSRINYLLEAQKLGVRGHPQIYLQILEELRLIYWERKEYKKAFDTKKEKHSIEHQYGLRTFMGAGWLKPNKTAKQVLKVVEEKENIALEITASGRLLDVERLVQRLGDNNYRLIVLHGQSGVGKSSLLNGGLIPMLKQKVMGIQENFPLLMRVYNNWVTELGNILKNALIEKYFPVENSLNTIEDILQELRESAERNFRTILIFDQFEEFFFIYPEPGARKIFFDFLGECLNISCVKIMLSLREDYIHYLLECNSLESMKMISQDILSKNVLYRLGNFSQKDTELIISQLTKVSPSPLEPELIKAVAQDLAGDLGQVRPIELQIVGAQLQTEKITTLAEYQKRGPKQELVTRYLEEVVKDCGEENRKITELILYLLTDEQGTRPLKTHADLEQNLQNLALIKELSQGSERLDLILTIFVESGLVVLLPESPADRYQLVHDYLAVLIRQQQEPQLKALRAQLEEERQKRRKIEAKANRFLKGALFIAVVAIFTLVGVASLANKQKRKAEISVLQAESNYTDTLLNSHQYFQALLESLKAATRLKKNSGIPGESYLQVSASLTQALENVTVSNILESHTSYVTHVSFSPDGHTIATASWDKTVKLWNTEGQLLKTLQNHTAPVLSVSFSPDGKMIASGSYDGTLKLWNTEGQLLKTLQSHTDPVTSVSFSPDGKILATASDDKTVKLWNTEGKLLHTLQSHIAGVNSVSFSLDGKTIATASDDKTVKLWNTEGKLLNTLESHIAGVKSVSFSPDGKMLATASGDATVKLWNTEGKLLNTLESHTAGVNSVSFSPDGKILASVSNDKTLKLWNTEGKVLKTLQSHNAPITSVSFSRDGKMIATASNDKRVKLWNTQRQRPKTLQSHISRVWGVSFSPYGNMIGTASNDKTVKLWNTEGKLLHTLESHTDAVWRVSFSPDGKTLASASDDKTVKLWNTEGKLLKTLKSHTAGVNSVSFSPDGKTLASASDDKTVKLWNTEGKLLHTLESHTDAVWRVSFSPDGKTLASASRDNTVKLWTTEGKLLKTLQSHTDAVTSVSFSPDGKTLASGSRDNTVKLWTTEGKLLHTLESHTDAVLSISFSPDGKTLASASDDKTIKLWNREGQLLKTLESHTAGVTSVSFSPDGKMIASASYDNTVKLWNLDFDDLVKRGCYWLHNYLITHPESLTELTVCQTPELFRQGAPFLQMKGEELARNGDIDNAIVNFQTALKWNPNIKFDPTTKAEKLFQSQQLINQGNESAKAGKIKEATTQFQRAILLDPSLRLNPEVIVRQLASEGLVKQGDKFVKDGKFKDAIELYHRTKSIHPDFEIPDSSWQNLCKNGILNGSVTDVIFVCEKLVSLHGDSPDFRELRGVARALTGNTQGAIEDFQFVVKETNDPQSKSQRQGWIKDLKAGKNPFTPDVINKMLNE